MTIRRNGDQPRLHRARKTAPRAPLLALLFVFAAGCGAAATTLLPSTAPSGTQSPTGIAAATTGAPGTPTLAPTRTAERTAATATATPPPTAPPTAPPTTPPTAHPTPVITPPPASGPSVYVSNGSRSSGKVALTFDFGGRVGDAKAIVDYLIAHDVHATIFITGKQIDTTAEGPEVLRQICPLSSQFALGNHSYNHPDFDGISAERMKTELLTTEAAFAKYCNRSPRPYFRPPGGALGGWQTAKFKEIMATVGSVGYSRTIVWDCDTIDWSPDTTKTQIIDRVHAKAQSGSIVLMHLGGYATLAALPSVLADVEAKGLTPVTLPELGV